MLLSLAVDRPGPAPRNLPSLQNNQFFAQSGDILTEDFCRLGAYRFVRCMLEFPLIEREERFLIGLWGTLSAENFDRYVELFDERRTEELANMFSWISNSVTSDMTAPLAAVMVTQPDAQRPQLYIDDAEHPLSALQRDGLSPENLRHLLAGFGHTDLRPRTR